MTFITFGPVSFLRVGPVWSLDVWRCGVFGQGWRFQFRRVRG